MITFKDIVKHEAVRTYIQKADDYLREIGYTEHSFPHCTKVAETAGYILKTLGFSENEVELVKIAGYLHDIGNLVNRAEHSQSGAIIAFRILDKLGMEPAHIADIITAIGSHDEGTGIPVNKLSAALFIADKSDVRRSRVRNNNFSTFDIHDRVNYSVESSKLTISEDKKEISLVLTIDTEFSSIADYFEIFLERMLLCKKASEKLGLAFHLVINGQYMM